MKKNLVLLIFLIPFFVFPQEGLKLTKKGRKVLFTNNNPVMVCTWATSNNDLDRAYYGKFKSLSADSLKMVVNLIEWQIPPKNRKTYGKDYPRDTIVNLPISNINIICRERNMLKNITGNVTKISIISALLISPIVSIDIQNESFRWSICRKISGISLSVLTLSIATQICFEKKKYRIQSVYRKKNLWEIEY